VFSGRLIDPETELDDPALLQSRTPSASSGLKSFPQTEQDDLSSALYDPSSAYLTIVLVKETKGEDFEDLDMLGKLLGGPTSSIGPMAQASIPVAADNSADASCQREEHVWSRDMTETGDILEIPSRSRVEQQLAGMTLGPTSPKRPLIEVISASFDDERETESALDDSGFKPSEDLLRERRALLEGRSLGPLKVIHCRVQ
jgi:hypothetical protein